MVLLVESLTNSITWDLSEMQILKPIPDLLNQKLWEQYLDICVLKYTSGDSDVHWSLKNY